MNYEFTEELYKRFLNLSQTEKERLLAQIEETYYAFNSATVKGFLSSCKEENLMLADGENTDLVTTELLENPYRAVIKLKQKPEHLQVLPKTHFNKTDYGLSEIRQRWILLLNAAFRELKEKGLTPFTEKIVAVYKLHFEVLADTDNYSMRFINNCLRDVGLIQDDNLNYVSSHYIGVVDPENSGLEIILLKEKDFADFHKNYIIHNN